MLKLKEKEFWEKANELKKIDPKNSLLEKICAGHDRFTELYLLNALNAFARSSSDNVLVVEKVNTSKLKKCIIITGNIGSGKSALAKEIVKALTIKYFCLDDYRLRVDKTLDAQSRDNICERQLAADVFKEQNVLYESTGVSGFFRNMVDEMKRNGYEIKTIHLICSDETCLRRAESRPQKSVMPAFAHGLKHGIYYVSKHWKIVKSDFEFNTEAESIEEIKAQLLPDLTHFLNGTVKSETKIDYSIPSNSAELVNQMNAMIAQKRKLSNKFWDVQNNLNACKELSTQILFYETQIEDLRDKIRYFNANGHQRPEEPVQKNELNDNSKYDLQKRLLSTRVMIAQVQKELETAASSKDAAKIQSREKRLVELKNQRDAITNQLQEAAL